MSGEVTYFHGGPGWLPMVALLSAASLLLGNIAMAIYMLNQLFRLPTNATMEQLLLRRK